MEAHTHSVLTIRAILNFVGTRNGGRDVFVEEWGIEMQGETDKVMDTVIHICTLLLSRY
jgi:hypothetical protein